jgi:hypothetical protein
MDSLGVCIDLILPAALGASTFQNPQGLPGLVQGLLAFYDLIFMDPCIVDDSVEIPTRCSFVIEFIIPKFIEGSTCFERHTAHHQEL